jgi:[glutamine synthetase] adenylyltransferase / [glutamine synthetase]-adenylyl-L-tyrosine phosphorylase
VDVKLDRGGIRDIEFLVQCLQRVYGGEEKWLRSSGTLFSLQKLHDKGHLSGQDFHRLTQAYQFLRRLEHRLQLQRGQQLHRVPSDSESLAVLQRAMSSGPVQSNADLVESIERHRTAVTAIYDRIVLKEKRRAKLGGGVLLPSAKTPREMSFEQLLERIGEDSSAIHEIANRPFPVSTRRNLHRFLASTMTTTERYAELLTNPEAVERAIQLFGVSDYLTDILVRHPDTIRALDRMISEEVALPPVPLPVGGVHSASSLDSLRQHFRQASFSIAASDVLAPGPAFQSMRKNSRLADSAICQALKLAGGADKLAVFALGRLGTQEFDIASDADLLFVRDPSSDPEAARMAAEKLVHALAAYTREGALFAVDARLRPHGKEGELVITPAQLERYLADEAQPWEALTYSKLHFVAGCDHLAASLLPKVRHSVAEMAVRAGFVQSVLEMRTRLEKSNRYPGSFKLARGGFYDIDFIASFLMLRYGSLHSGNTLERLEHLHRCGALDAGTFQDLRDSTLLYRTTDHVIRLVTGRARPELPAAEHAREAVQELTDEILRRSKLQTLQTELSATSVRVRHAFAHFLHP